MTRVRRSPGEMISKSYDTYTFNLRKCAKRYGTIVV